MSERNNAEATDVREVTDKTQEMQQLIQLSRQGQPAPESTQSPDGRFENVPFFDPAATYFNR